MEGEGEGLRYRGAGAKDVDEIYALEAASYPEDEAATREGSLLCVHSVVVAPALRRKGVALAMLREYVQSLRRDGENGVKEVRLICKEGLKGLYLKAGFDLVGPSPVVHGKDPWFEMKLGLH